MRARIGLGVLAPSLAQMWTSFKSWGGENKENQQQQSWPQSPILFDQCSKWDGNWDGRRPESLLADPKSTRYLDQEEYSQKLSNKRSKATRHLILIRHGQYEDTAKTDDLRHLTEKGRLQARATGRRLKELRAAGIFPFDTMINSTLNRACETADLIFDELKEEKSPSSIARKPDPLLIEGSPCPPEPHTASWRPESYYIEDGARIEAAFRRHFYRAPPDQEKDSYEVLVCHGNVIRYFVCRALQFPAQGWLRMSVYHASITWMAIRPSGHVSLRCLGDTGHLPPELVTVR